MKYVWLTFSIILSISISANAQYFETGQDPSRIHWKQINTSKFQVIFPEEFENEAQRFTYILSKVYEYGSKSLNHEPRKISVVLHTQTVKSNGLLAWAPKRIELFTTPHQQIYSQDWLEQLALHEFRHVVQLDKIEVELPLIVKLLLGEQATAIVTGLYLPFWFIEGDAVVTETALSNSGRGRLASFGMEHRAQLAEKGKYNFDKAYLGSYKDFVPDHYKLGYLLIGNGREKYGSQIWSDALRKIGEHPLSINPLSSSLKRDIGLKPEAFYNQLFDSLTQEWKRINDFQPIFSIKKLSPPQKFFTDYLYPSFYRDSLIFAYRNSLNDIGRFVLIYPDQSEKIIYTPGTIFEESVSMNEQLIIWAEKREDLRWAHADQSVINILNIETHKKKELSFQNKLFSPVISPNFKSFAAVEVDKQNQIFLSIFNLENDERIFRFQTDDNQYFFTPCWDVKGETLFLVALSHKGKYLASLDIQTKELKKLTTETFGNIKNPVFVNENQLIFSSDFSGKDNLYSVDPSNGKIMMVFEAKFGVDYPSSLNTKKQILFSNYTSDGYQISTFELPQAHHKEVVRDITLRKNILAEHLADQEMGVPDLYHADSIQLQSKKYKKASHLFNFHSWAPVYMNLNSYDIQPGVTFLSQNVLGTAFTQIGYEYNLNDRTGKIKASFQYKGWLPEITSSVSYGNEASNYYLITNTTNQSNQIVSSDTTLQRFKWEDLSGDLDLRLPLNLSKGKYSTILYPEAKYTYNRVNHQSSTPSGFYSGEYHALTYRLYFYHLLRQSMRNLMPRWGQQIDLTYRHTPITGNDLGSIAAIQTNLYIPGFAKNDGFKIYQGYQEKIFNQTYNFSNIVRFPHGISSYQNNKMYSLTVDYKIPLYYPDYSFGRLLYLKRIKTGLFYNYTWLSIPAFDQNRNIIPNHHQLELTSMGIEVTSDVHLLRFFAPIEIGMRTIYLPESSSFGFDFLFSIDFNGF
jgi:hypothetical protein